jgi:hypothetical protein
VQIITGCINTPVFIPDTDIEDSFDLQGCFVGKLPFDPDRIGKDLERKREFIYFESSILASVVAPRKALVEQPQAQPQSTLPPRTQMQLVPRRPPSESALRSMASTTTTNAFLMRTRPILTTNRFTTATTTVPTPSANFQFQGFNSNNITISTTK